MNATQVVSTTAPAIYSLGSAYYFAPETLQVGKEAGLDGFRFYFLGRGGVLGDVEAPVIASAFGYFEPTLLQGMWDSAREVMSPREAARLHLQCAHRYGRAHFSQVGGLDDFCAAAETIVAAADPAGLALFAGYASEPLPEDLPARAMQLVAVLRELRGSAHLLAVVASGLAPKAAHYLKRPGDFGLFGWSDDDVPQVTDDDHRAMAAAEELTDRLVRVPYEALDGYGRTSFVTGVERMEAALAVGEP
ncbi:MAG: evbL [Actinomycetota bacterium]|jgi:hypothetical protein|nr:evbL [Actinomycetota bacterium]